MDGAQEVKRLAELARLSISESTQARFAKDLESILAYVGKLETLSVDLTVGKDGVAPAANVFRADGEPYTPGTWAEAITEQFPKREGDSLSVKKIISHE